MMGTCSHCIDTLTYTKGVMTGRSGAYVQSPLPGVSAAPLSLLVCSQRWLTLCGVTQVCADSRHLRGVSDCCMPAAG